ncbi:MAG: hypothetical protein V1910_01310 [bacterium]
MLDFLQQKNNKQIIFEYLLRISIYLLLFIFISSLILISLFLPSFFFAKYKIEAINNQLESIKQKNLENGEDAISFIKNVNKLSLALSDNSNFTNSDIINKIVSLKNKDIKISSISISDNTEGKIILINGIANTRDSLILFEKEIKTDGFFNTAIFPILYFLKSSDLNFSATLTCKL